MDLKHEPQPINNNGSIYGLEAKDTISTFQSPSETDVEKVSWILSACQENDLGSLAALATSPGGLLEDQLRRSACK